MSGIVKIEDFKIENVKLSEIKSSKKGGKVVYINYDYEDGSSPKKLMIRLPRLKVPFGISGWNADGKTAEDKRILSINSNDLMELSLNESHKFILQKIEQIEEMVINFAIKNSKDLLGKKYKEDMVKELYSTCIKYSVDKDGKNLDYPPRLRCKLTKNESGEYLTKFFDSSKQRLKINVDNYNEMFPKMSDCLSIVACSNIWVVGTKFGVTFRPEQVKVYKSEGLLEDYAFGDDSDDEDVNKIMNELVLESTKTNDIEENVNESDDLDN